MYSWCSRIVQFQEGNFERINGSQKELSSFLFLCFLSFSKQRISFLHFEFRKYSNNEPTAAEHTAEKVEIRSAGRNILSFCFDIMFADVAIERASISVMFRLDYRHFSWFPFREVFHHLNPSRFYFLLSMLSGGEAKNPLDRKMLPWLRDSKRASRKKCMIENHMVEVNFFHNLLKWLCVCLWNEMLHSLSEGISVY